MAEYRRFLGPAVLLVAVTIAVVLIRVFAEHHDTSSPPATTTTQTVATRATWTVKAGDTLPKIAASSGIPLATIRRLNPHVSATTLFIGEKIHLR
ncbi:MAG TPA: LysM domain-containing protein [Gaiellaceae bacterium]|nr:LysM domain-containing protein [Gaiellaceae bacterium]